MIIEGVTYEIEWQKFRRGTSIFIPCLDCAEAKKAVQAVFARLRIRRKDVLIKVVIVEGIRGLRIWRL
jgi:hypothetical protein